jgi:long-chain acyl-CoA synthetase
MTCTIHYGTQTVTDDALEILIKRASSGFASLGVQPGDVVAIMLRNDPAYLVALLGARVAGAHFCPVNWHFKADEVGYILQDCAAKVLVIGAELLPQLQAVDGSYAVPEGVTVLAVEASDVTQTAYGTGDANALRAARAQAVAHGMQAWDAWLGAQSDAGVVAPPPGSLLPYTSGTTGRPKGVRRRPIAPAEAALLAQRAGAIATQVLGIEPGMRALLAAPLYHSAPNGYGVYVALQPNTLLVLETKFEAERALALIAQHKLTHAYMVPTMFVRLLRLSPEVRARYNLSSLRFIGCTGSPCAPEVKREIVAWLGPVLSEAYASSETGYVTQISSQESQRKPGSVGKPLPGAIVKILDEAGNALPVGEVGLIYCRQTAYPDMEYINQPEARAKIDHGGLMCVGDMGYFDADGYLYISDRKSDMVISGGVNIYPAEIEKVLITMPGVADCAVFGIPDEEFGEALAAAVQLREGVQVGEGSGAGAGAGEKSAAEVTKEVVAKEAVTKEVVTKDSVRNFLRERIASYKVPREVAFHAQLPREESGKIFKRRLREPYWQGVNRKI